MYGSPEMYFDLAKLRHRELIDEAARDRVASCAARLRRSRHQARERVPR